MTWAFRASVMRRYVVVPVVVIFEGLVERQLSLHTIHRPTKKTPLRLALLPLTVVTCAVAVVGVV